MSQLEESEKSHGEDIVEYHWGEIGVKETDPARLIRVNASLVKPSPRDTLFSHMIPLNKESCNSLDLKYVLDLISAFSVIFV